MANWLEHSVQVDIPRPVATVWRYWADLEQMPRWMKWIQAVHVSPEDPNLSTWELGTPEFSFSWRSRVVRSVERQIVQWESVGGLQNRGAARFYGHQDGTTTVRLSVAYAIPFPLGQIMDSLFLGNLVESTLQKDMERFRDFVLQETTPQPTPNSP